jgi:hypothetical protein
MGIILFPAFLAAHAQTPVSVKTKDGFGLAIAPNGFVSAIRLDQRELPLSRNPAMFRIRDAAAKSGFVPVQCSVLGGPDDLRLASADKPFGMNITARIVSRGGFLQIDGEVAEHAGRDRCLDLKISLPVATNGFAWGTGLAGIVVPKAAGQKGKKNSPAEVELDESVPDDNAWYPLSAASNPELKAGLSLAVPPTHPTRFLTGKDGSGPFILLRRTFSIRRDPRSHSVSDCSLSPRSRLGLSLLVGSLLRILYARVFHAAREKNRSVDYSKRLPAEASGALCLS